MSSNTTPSSGVALTTFDNPFNPFSHFNEWFLWDVNHGYNSCAYLARIARTSSQLTDEENAAEIERAVDEIVSLDFTNKYRKIRPNDDPLKLNSSTVG